jgi:hypothetical protein
MPFDTGSISMTVFKINEDIPENYIDLFQQFAAGKLDEVTDELQEGWVTGRHLLESDINETTAIRGGYLFLNYRRAIRKVPASLLNAICKREELLWMEENATHYVPRKVKQTIKEEQSEKYLVKMPPQITGTQFVLDLNNKFLYLATTSNAIIDGFLALIKETLNIFPYQINAQTLSLLDLQLNLADVSSLAFSSKFLSHEGSVPTDFLTWLWYASETKSGKVLDGKYGDFQIDVIAPMTLVFNFQSEEGIEETIVKKGVPERSIEARMALSAGKKLNKSGVQITRGDDIWTFTFDASKFTFTSLRLPDGEEMELHSKFEERINNLHIMYEVFTELFKKYITTAATDELETLQKSVLAWAENQEVL